MLSSTTIVLKLPVTRSLFWRRNSAMISLLSVYFQSLGSLRSKGSVDRECCSPTIWQPATAPCKVQNGCALYRFLLGSPFFPLPLCLRVTLSSHSLLQARNPPPRSSTPCLRYHPRWIKSKKCGSRHRGLRRRRHYLWFFVLFPYVMNAQVMTPRNL